MEWWEILWETRWMAVDIAKKLIRLHNLELNEHDFEDLISEMIVGALKRLQNFNYNPEMGKVSTIVWRALEWAGEDYLKKYVKKSKKKVQIIYVEPVELRKYENPHGGGKMEELEFVIKEMIERIPDENWRCVLKLKMEGYLIKEIAEIMDLPEGTVKTYLKRARDFLFKSLDERRKI